MESKSSFRRALGGCRERNKFIAVTNGEMGCNMYGKNGGKNECVGLCLRGYEALVVDRRPVLAAEILHGPDARCRVVSEAAVLPRNHPWAEQRVELQTARRHSAERDAFAPLTLARRENKLAWQVNVIHRTILSASSGTYEKIHPVMYAENGV